MLRKKMLENLTENGNKSYFPEFEKLLMKIGKSPWMLSLCALAAVCAGTPSRAQDAQPVSDEKLEIVAAGTVGEEESVIRRRYPGRIVSPATIAVTSRVSGDLLEVAFK